FGDKYILANIVVLPLPKPLGCDEQNEYDHLARNKFLTRDIWQSFVYRRLYDLFRKHLAEHDKDNDPLFQLNKEYRLNWAERPYLQMKYEFRDKTYRNSLNILFKEKHTSLHDTCIYLEISDQGRTIFDKVEDRDRTVLRLLKEIGELKRASTKLSNEATTPTTVNSNRSTTVFEEYHPEPVKKCLKSTVEEYVPLTRNGLAPGTKRTYKPSKITDSSAKSISNSEHDPYSPGTIDTPLKVSYTPTSSPLNKLETPSKSSTKTVDAEKNLFGSDDDEEYDPANCLLQPPANYNTNDSEKDMFADSEQFCSSDREKHGDTDPERNSSDRSTARSNVAKREVLPRSSKQNSRALVESPEEKEKRKAKALKKNGSSKTEENLNALLKLKNSIRKKNAPKREGTVAGKQTKVERFAEIATEMRRFSKGEVLDCTNLSKEEILDTFGRYRHELQDIFMRYKDLTERQWKASNELCYFTDIGHILDDEQKFTMLQQLEDEFVPQQERGKYTEFFTSSLLMEWGLRLFMDRHEFEDRQSALERIRQQEKSYLASLSNDFLLKYQ
uniref:Uncharacterized protein n=1 Tax=Anopheles dirus TaxID=7168 RepID=A0A182NGH4_9DIPT